MSDKKYSRKEIFQNYYEDLDYENVLEKLPDIIEEAELKAAEVLEPTIYEKREVRKVIENFIREKNRKVYGGTAINELLKKVDPNDAIYSEYVFSDIEFYSPTPIPDLVDLCNILYNKGYKYVQGKEAQHEETYSIFVNLQLYCDITYVPVHVYNGIKTIEIDGISYTDPHFMFIDYLRMFNDPMNAAWRWEKAFKRVYLLLKDYPLEYYDKRMQLPKTSKTIENFMSMIKEKFMMDADNQKYCLIMGFDAYNFYIRHAANDKNVEQLARITQGNTNLNNLLVNVPYMELISINYNETVIKLYNYIKSIIDDKENITLEEYFPLFQFTNYSVIIKYKDEPIVKIYDANRMCIPNIKTTNGYMYVSYQYILMMMFINKFKAHLDKNKSMYFNYGIAISNLIKARNIFLAENNLSVINKTVFSEFKISCVGSTISYMRMSLLRKLKRRNQGKKIHFAYTPEEFFKLSSDAQAKFEPSKHLFRNTSGNMIRNPKNLIFKLDEDKNIIVVNDSENSESENESSE